MKTLWEIPWWSIGQDYLLSLLRVWVQSLIWELRSYMQHGMAKKKKKPQDTRSACQNHYYSCILAMNIQLYVSNLVFCYATPGKPIHKGKKDKLWYIHTMECYLTIKRDETLKREITCMNLKGIMLSERSWYQEATGTSLVVQWIKLHAPNAGGPVRSLVGELRSHVPRLSPRTATREALMPRRRPRAAKINN